MSEVWKSTAKKFCEVCKVWFADNRASVEHHERGEKHKAALSIKLRELSRKQDQKTKAEATMNATLAAMTAAAEASMRKNNEGLAQGPALPATGIRQTAFDPRGKDIHSMASEMGKRKYMAQEIQPEYYGHSRKLVKIDHSAYDKIDMERYQKILDKKNAPKKVVEKPKEWVEAEVEDGSGRKYFYHMLTGETVWEPPEQYFTIMEYEIHLAQLDADAMIRVQEMENPEEPEVDAYAIEQQVKAELAAAVATDYDDIMDEEEEESQEYARESAGPSFTAMPPLPPAPPQFKAAPAAPGFTAMPDSATQFRHFIPDHTKDNRKGRRELRRHQDTLYGKEPNFPSRQPLETAPADNIPLPPPCEIPVPIEVTEPVRQEQQEDPDLGRVTHFGKDQRPLLELRDPSHINSTGLGGWTKVVKDESKQEVFESPLTARYRIEEEKQRLEEEERAKIQEKLQPKIEFTEKVATTITKKVKGPIEFKKKTGPKNVRKREE